jgi:hypothetical protein
MQAKLKKIFLAALPLVGLLFFSPAVFAHDNDWQHERFHNRLGEMHREFHEHPYSKWEHKRFHRWLKREHRGFHNDRDWGYGGQRYYDNDRYRGGWYGSRDYYGNGGYYGGRNYYNNNYYGYGLPWWGWFSR